MGSPLGRIGFGRVALTAVRAFTSRASTGTRTNSKKMVDAVVITASIVGGAAAYSAFKTSAADHETQQFNTTAKRLGKKFNLRHLEVKTMELGKVMAELDYVAYTRYKAATNETTVFIDKRTFNSSPVIAELIYVHEACHNATQLSSGKPYRDDIPVQGISCAPATAREQSEFETATFFNEIKYAYQKHPHLFELPSADDSAQVQLEKKFFKKHVVNAFFSHLMASRSKELMDFCLSQPSVKAAMAVMPKSD